MEPELLLFFTGTRKMKRIDSNGKRVGRNLLLSGFLCLGMIQPLFAASTDSTDSVNDLNIIAGAEDVLLPGNSDRRIFEGDLQRFAGTYAIYSWLPEHDQEAVYRASRDGASMKDIRKLVISKRRMRY